MSCLWAIRSTLGSSASSDAARLKLTLSKLPASEKFLFTACVHLADVRSLMGFGSPFGMTSAYQVCGTAEAVPFQIQTDPELHSAGAGEGPCPYTSKVKS